MALMYAGGQLLETFAAGRVCHETAALLGRVARTVMRYTSSTLEEILITAIVPGNRLLILHGKVLPVDDTVSGTRAKLGLSALTGESSPVQVPGGGEALSGATLINTPFDLLVTSPAAESIYAGIVRLVEAAQNARAPMARLADRYAIGFLVLIVAMAGIACALSADPLRALAVLVVATPCPAYPGGPGGDHFGSVAHHPHCRAGQEWRHARNPGTRSISPCSTRPAP
ncbi:MAG: hypothetical protein MO846_09390 [Candidatus Devosia symbiotica]|nr:hypothetical protein [Candidatus Devosia symbiotica]